MKAQSFPPSAQRAATEQLHPILHTPAVCEFLEEIRPKPGRYIFILFLCVLMPLFANLMCGGPNGAMVISVFSACVVAGLYRFFYHIYTDCKRLCPISLEALLREQSGAGLQKGNGTP
jgi:hypothetical protein